MKETCYISADEIIGPCGPCSFINMLGLKGSPKLEKELAEEGRLKPFYPSDFTSFLAWAEKYKIKLKIFVSTKELPDKTFEMMFKYEKIPKAEQQKKKKECLERRNKILKENKSEVNLLKGEALDKIKELINQGYIVAFRIAEDYHNRGFLAGHMRVVYKKEGSTYFIKDSAQGLLKLSEKEMKIDLDNLKKMDSKFEIIAYKPNSESH